MLRIVLTSGVRHGHTHAHYCINAPTFVPFTASNALLFARSNRIVIISGISDQRTRRGSRGVEGPCVV